MRHSRPDATANEPACERRALELLARREHSRAQLTRKLAVQGFSAEIVEPVLDRLEASGLLAATRFADELIRSRAAKGRGPVRIRAELKEHGVGEPDAAAALATDEYDWIAAARAVRRKRFGPGKPKDFKERARQARFLEYRGFDHRQIQAALEFPDDSD